MDFEKRESIFVDVEKKESLFVDAEKRESLFVEVKKGGYLLMRAIKVRLVSFQNCLIPPQSP